MRNLTSANQGSREEQGSALLISMLITTILSLLGMSFLVLADTENKISVNDLDTLQPEYVAEAGIQIVQSWFDSPNPARNPLVPSVDQVSLDQRRGDITGDGVDDPILDGSLGNIYRGGNASGSSRLFDKPYRWASPWTLWGRRDAPDVLITPSTHRNGAPPYLDKVNSLFGKTPDLKDATFRITEIRLYGPPVSWPDGARLGIGTVEVTADKIWGNRTIGRRVLRAVLQEIRYPSPVGSIESEGAITENGSIGAHWGGVLSEDKLYEPRTTSANFPMSSVPRAGHEKLQYADFSATAPDLVGENPGRQNLLTELLGISVLGQTPGKAPVAAPIEDAWLRMLSQTGIRLGNGSAPGGTQPWPWDIRTVNLQNREDKSNHFQNIPVQFPEIRYEEWKTTSQAARRHTHYFAYAGLENGEPVFRENGMGPARRFMEWVNTELPGIAPGIFFFDTVNGQDPQNGGPGILTPEVHMNSSDVPGSYLYVMRGVIYLNASMLSSSGIAGKAVPMDAVMPGEPFLDTGVDLNHDGLIDPGTAGNKKWDVDLNGDTKSDADDLTVAPFTAHNGWVPGTLPDGGADPRFLPLQPHEPFLNLLYPEIGSGDFTTRVAFDAEFDNARPVEDSNADGLYVPGQDRFTTLGRDGQGALFRITTNLNGVFFNEGSYGGTGNFKGYGAFLMKNSFTGTGSIDLYYDDRLERNVWPPEEYELPRVEVSALDTQ